MEDPQHTAPVTTLIRRLAAIVPRDGIARTIFGVSALTIVLLVAGVACMGDDGPRRGPTFTISTFTPTPPDHTPEALVTRDAQATAWSQTATAAPAVTATPPGATTEPGAGQTPVGDDEIRPPDLILTTDGGQTRASVGSFNWCSSVMNQCADIRAGYVVLNEASGSWSAGTAGTITTPNTEFPPQNAEAMLYVHDDNAAIPQDETGTIIGSDLAFVPMTAPMQIETFSGTDMTMTPTVAPGKYILVVQVNWETPAGVSRPLHTQYAFVVEIL